LFLSDGGRELSAFSDQPGNRKTSDREVIASLRVRQIG
jgi:hypothetical protein